MQREKLLLALALYTLMAVSAFLLGLASGDHDLFVHPDPLVSLPALARIPAGLALGAAVGIVIAWITQKAVEPWRWRPAVGLHLGLRQLLGVADRPLGERDVLLLAISSAIAEEAFFRGWLMCSVGLVLSSIAFGLAHYVPAARPMRAWVPMAVVMGVILGLLFRASGGLEAPIAAHFAINYRNLHFVSSFDPGLCVGGPVPGGSRSA